MELTDDELARVRAAFHFSAGGSYLSRTVLEDARHSKREFKSLLSLWEKVSDSTRAAVEVKLAALTTPGMEDGAPFAVEPDALDIGAALRSLLAESKDRKGAKTRLPGFKDAVREAVAVWQDRQEGRAVEVGQFRRDTRMHHPYPLLDFVANAMEHVLSAPEVATATAMIRPNRIDLLRAVDTQLRALRQSGAI